MISMILLSAPLYLVGHPFWLWSSVAILLCALLPNYRFAILVAFNLFNWLGSNSFLSEQAIDVNRSLWSAELPIPVVRAIIIFITLTLFWSIARLTKNVKAIWAPAIASAPILITILVLKLNIIGNPTITGMLNLICRSMSAAAFYFLWMIHSKGTQGKEGLKNFAFILPFLGYVLPVPGTYTQLAQTHSPTANGKKILLYSLLLILINDLIKQLFLKPYQVNSIFPNVIPSIIELPVLYSDGLFDSVSNHGILLATLTPLVRMTAFFIDYICLFSIQVGFLRTIGFNVLPQASYPWRSHSLFNYFVRTQYYYAKVMLEIFFKPTFLLFNRLKNFNSRLLVSAGLSVMAMGIFVRILTSVPARMDKFPLYALAEAIKDNFIYYGLIFIALAAQLILGRRESHDLSEKNHWLRSLWYHALFCFISYYALLIGTFHENPWLSWPFKQFKNVIGPMR